jgi:hypothetical protein
VPDKIEVMVSNKKGGTMHKKISEYLAIFGSGVVLMTVGCTHQEQVKPLSEQIVKAQSITADSPIPAPTNLGLVGIKSINHAYLQAHTDGEMHASNMHRNEEETWFLIEVNKQKHLYGLQNWRTGHYMSKRSSCAPANSEVLGPTEQWILINGQNFGVVNAVAIRSAADGTFLGANPPGHDNDACGGEVGSGDPNGPVANSGWPGWWVLEPATTPSPGQDAWNTIGNMFKGIVVQGAPLVLDALEAALLTGG